MDAPAPTTGVPNAADQQKLLDFLSALVKPGSTSEQAQANLANLFRTGKLTQEMVTQVRDALAMRESMNLNCL